VQLLQDLLNRLCGEVGVGNFFMDHIDFGNKDFSRVLYTGIVIRMNAKKEGPFQTPSLS